MDVEVGDYVEIACGWEGAIWEVTQIDEPPSGTVTGRFSSACLINDWHGTVHVTLVLPASGWSWAEMPNMKTMMPSFVKAINQVEAFIRMANWIPKKLVVYKPVPVPKRILPPGGSTVRRQRIRRHQHRGAA